MVSPKVVPPNLTGALVPEPPEVVLAALLDVARRAYKDQPGGGSPAQLALFGRMGCHLWQLAYTLIEGAAGAPRVPDLRATLKRARDRAARGEADALATLPDDLALLVAAERLRSPAVGLVECLDAAASRPEVETPRVGKLSDEARELAAQAATLLDALDLPPSGWREGLTVALLLAIGASPVRLGEPGLVTKLGRKQSSPEAWERHVEKALRRRAAEHDDPGSVWSAQVQAWRILRRDLEALGAGKLPPIPDCLPPAS